MSVVPCKSVDASPCPGRGVTGLTTALALMSSAPEADAVLGSFGTFQPAQMSDVQLVVDESPAHACIHPYFDQSLTVSSVASLLLMTCCRGTQAEAESFAEQDLAYLYRCDMLRLRGPSTY